MLYDPILHDTNQQLTLFPVQNQRIYQAYKTAAALYWNCDEISFVNDRKDYETLSYAEQHLLNLVLGFFAVSDALVNQNINDNFASEVKLQEIKMFYTFQCAIESVHQETYSLLIDILIADELKKNKLFRQIGPEFEPIQQKINFMRLYMSDDIPFNERLVAFSSVEGIFFSSCFATIFHFKRLNKMPGLCFSNELISRDEASHMEFAVLLHSELKEQVPDHKILEIIQQAVAIESIFIREAFKHPILGMNYKNMVQYVQFIADRLLKEYGCQPFYQVQCPYTWMNNQAMTGKTNFFEKKVSEYSKNINDTPASMEFSINSEF
jgi:ribonucleotide reductase beta subunit family protein with ferritin-like domain